MRLRSHVAPSGFKESGIGVGNGGLRVREDGSEVHIRECGR
jgi:hypothetical protein